MINIKLYKQFNDIASLGQIFQLMNSNVNNVKTVNNATMLKHSVRKKILPLCIPTYRCLYNVLLDLFKISGTCNYKIMVLKHHFNSHELHSIIIK